MMTSAAIRRKFLDFFKEKGHTIVPSAPIVVKNDPSLLFTNAGMNPFKDYFLGHTPPPYSRVADTQKCLRVSGKHNDLEEVGVDTYHHTMFEMLGNWSFGNAATEPAPYFKEKAIEWSWELLTKVFDIAPERLYVTYFEGDQSEGLPADEETLKFWKQWIPEERILPGSKKDNFWEMGNTGPCGPCTEIHVDMRDEAEKEKISGRELINTDHPQVIEIWNNVFIQFNRKSNGKLEPLPAVHVDTGMGFERLVRVLQQKDSNYDTDVFTGTLAAIEKISKKKYGGTSAPADIAFRVIADHIRAIAFAIADGQLPSNTGAGYVIRRILRRAVRYYYSALDMQKPLLHLLVPVLAAQFKEVFPELVRQQEFVVRAIHEEEQNFLRTLGSGIKRLEALMQEGKQISGEAAFELMDTYGFPIDLTVLMASESGMQVDEKGFEKEMAKQKARSRAATTINAGDWVVLDGEGQGKFIGYDRLQSESRILRYRRIKAKGKESFQIVLDQTPFYAESGGQVGDTGVLQWEDKKITVSDTKKENDLILHFADVLPEVPEAHVLAKVDEAKRMQTMAHHSATHLLHAALRQVLGTHVAQKGSLVNEQYLRFDFSHFSKMTPEEIRKIERSVNAQIRENIPLDEQRNIPMDEARKMGAMALFGEKYGENVRVIRFGDSIELCGGTHVEATGEIGFFKIISEGSVAAGIRRIEAYTGQKAENYLFDQLDALEEIKTMLKNPKNTVKAVSELLTKEQSLNNQLEELKSEKAQSIKAELLGKVEEVNGVNFLAEAVNLDNAAIKDIAFQLRKECSPLFMVLASEAKNKATIAVALSDELVKSNQYNSGKIVKELSQFIQGGGGGQPFFATAGGKKPQGIPEALNRAREILSQS